MTRAVASARVDPEEDERDPRSFVRLFDASPLRLESGRTLGPIDVAYETWGTLDAERGNAILVLHALTGDSHAAGDVGIFSPTPGWWDFAIGPGRPLDTRRFFVVCPNVLGGCRGTTGPASLAPDGSPYGSRFPEITIRDQVAVEAALADALGIDRFHAIVGGSMGGMRALEWIAGFPERAARAVVLATGAAATAEQIALGHLQERAIRLDPAFRDGDYHAFGVGPTEGIAIARGLGQISYRHERELELRFGRNVQGDPEPLRGGSYAIESYLRHHGRKLARRFDAGSYVVLTRAMSHHDVGRGRGGAVQALSHVTADTTVVGIPEDRLYPLRLQERLASFIPSARALVVVESDAGHDGFLVERAAIGQALRNALEPRASIGRT